MDTQTFWRQVESIAEEFNIGRHPFATAVKEGKATRDQIKNFAVEHYEMTVRDSGHYIAQGYISMAQIDKEGAQLMAENFVEEAMGMYTHTASHTELLFEFWEKGLGLARQELEQSSASPASRAMNAYFWMLVSRKAKYSGALGVLEGGFPKQLKTYLRVCRPIITWLQKPCVSFRDISRPTASMPRRAAS